MLALLVLLLHSAAPSGNLFGAGEFLVCIDRI